VYGTVMIGRFKGDFDEMTRRVRDWQADRGTPAGYVDQWALRADDGRIVVAVRFNSKDEYLKLADDPGQDEWYRTQLMPMLDGDPEWIDGEWHTV
jgi:hypothetical protein